jgi:hypothetical protein
VSDVRQMSSPSTQNIHSPGASFFATVRTLCQGVANDEVLVQLKSEVKHLVMLSVVRNINYVRWVHVT